MELLIIDGLGVSLRSKIIMKKERRLLNILKEIYIELFRQAEPSADFNKLIKSGETKKPNFFMIYYMPQSKQDSIIEGIFRRYRLNKLERTIMKGEIDLGCSPNSCKETWLEYRNEKR